MGKRLTLTDYLFTLVFIFMLVCIVGAFFYGVQVGKARSAEEYEKLLVKKYEAEHKLEAYHQQYLVSFYHTVLLPYREFQKTWFDSIHALTTEASGVKPKALLDDLAAAAKRQYDEIKITSMPESSPLLLEAHTKYMQSLKLFDVAFDKFDARGLSGHEIARAFDTDPYFVEAQQFALDAQNDFYAAIISWNETVRKLPNKEILAQESISLADWNKLELNLKNKFAGEWLSKHHHFVNYYPQDLVIRIDDLISSGQAEKLGLTTVNVVAETLIHTGAVRQGDFLKGHARYQHETLPQLPFFYAQN